MQYSQSLIKAFGDLVYERCISSGQVSWHGDFSSILGYPLEDMGTDNSVWLDRLYPEDQARVLSAIEEAFEQWQPYTIEYRFRHNNGSYIWIQDRGIPKDAIETDAADLKIVGVMRDISDRKQAELDMHHALIRERELNQLKTRFIDLASHEFRTPLTSILGFTELLEQYSHKFDPEVHRSHLRRIKNAAQRLQTLVDDVLSVSRVDAGNLELELAPTNIAMLCQDILQELEVVFDNTHACRLSLAESLQGDRPLLPLVDAKIIRHILTNLLSNALKYSFPGEPVDLEIHCAKNHITFFVTDQGIGIPNDDLLHLFEPFHRACNVGKIPGTGLGLHIVERYVNLHNGTIMVASTVNSGTQFRVNIPCIFIDDFGLSPQNVSFP
ncbi:MAG: PAS domain-containing protein [Limnothrix sp. RL_2_0]|nr:PAS domain-containing protein [Limnothrix sp. RL_2_0]